MSWLSEKHLGKLINSRPSILVNVSCFLALSRILFNRFHESAEAKDMIICLVISVCEKCNCLLHFSNG
ncbi:MAG: hypothetical protein IJQ68_04115 [Methanobrevibacter sp.]|uniref:hypothetical protein n=1 Tax=Methanobrevibacter sp. TaxID=66852 RepID=UPI0025FA441D|nr:hypothetical protein [Methanobrevibacter sp.]MBR0271162.1 hypothetical protein [Methanobrevibacter sp.]